MKGFIQNIGVVIIVIICEGLLIKANGQTWVAGQNVTLNVPDYALIATNNAAVSMNLTTSTAGSEVASATNSNLYVKISSRVPNNTKRTITARISNGTVPANTTLTLQSASCTTTHSGGSLGFPFFWPVTLGSSDQLLVWNIGTCYTGTGSTDGYRMTFNWSVANSNNYQQLASGTSNITVVFTLTAAQ